jgi:hypothetical protein
LLSSDGYSFSIIQLVPTTRRLGHVAFAICAFHHQKPFLAAKSGNSQLTFSI